jgi:hypothetical protein
MAWSPQPPNIQGNNAIHVVAGGGTNNTAVLDGFIITAGQANGSFGNGNGGGMNNDSSSPMLVNVTFSGNFASGGGGMYNSGYYKDPTLTNVTFSGNSASSGGGMYNNASSPTLTDVTFSGNSAANGGGMFNYRSGLTLTDATFSGNSAANGGGMNNSDSSPTLTNVIFSGNSASSDGGGMFNVGNSSPTLTNVTFSGNSATANGGGMRNHWQNCNPRLTNVTFSGNSAANGGGMFNSYKSNPTIINSILWGDTPDEIYNDDSNVAISYSNVQGCGGSGAGWNSACGTDGGNNIDADPLFANATGGNLRLQLTSPAIDAGNNAAVPAGITTDLDGKPRYMDISTVPDTGSGSPPIVDIGAYEAHSIFLVYLPLVVRNAP